MGWALRLGIHCNDDYTQHIPQMPLPHSIFGSVLETLEDAVYVALFLTDAFVISLHAFLFLWRRISLGASASIRSLVRREELGKQVAVHKTSVQARITAMCCFKCS